MLGTISRVSNQFGRNVMKNFVRNGSHGGVPGENLPFNIHNRTRLTFHMMWFIGSGMSAPFLLLWYQLSKK
ncbi:hypothetical protein RR46_12554 [Papilio xuthus]|uniref:Cytochrome c oxidase subunit 7C, mitochondrial n=1 Tax=Papilio xuthus TaxID=66420 RepID=A0A194PUU9_PAPXU|nr:hypothetical protein RR46_12554 [Papilio xuthus]